MATIMSDPNNWNDDELLINHLAGELLECRLGLLLGAGVSAGFGLPNWVTLISRLSDDFGLGAVDDKTNLLRRAEAIQMKAAVISQSTYFDAVHKSLYKDVNIDFDKLISQKLLSAIASLVIASGRGSASAVVTLNFDNILEIYLEYFGLLVRSVHKERHWHSVADVTVYHPHGFLPLEGDRSDQITLTSGDFLRAIQDRPDNVWRSLMLSLMRTRTFLHIGLSGDDLNVESLLVQVSSVHACEALMPYHSIWFASSSVDNDTVAVLKKRGVFTKKLDSWDLLPPFIFKICQSARKMRAAL